MCVGHVSVRYVTDTHTKTHKDTQRHIGLGSENYVQNVICYLHVHTNNIYIPYKMHMRVHKPTPYACTHANSHTHVHKPTPVSTLSTSQRHMHVLVRKPTQSAHCMEACAQVPTQVGRRAGNRAWSRESRVVAAPTTRLTDHAAAATWLHLWGSFSLSCLTETQKRHTSQRDTSQRDTSQRDTSQRDTSQRDTSHRNTRRY